MRLVKLRHAIVLATLTLAACAQQQAQIEPGRFKNFFEAYRQGTINDATKRGSTVPFGVEWKWADCTAQFVVSKIDPATLQRLDAVARGQATMPVDEVKAATRPAIGILRKDPGFSSLEPFCPNDVASFRQYYTADRLI